VAARQTVLVLKLEKYVINSIPTFKMLQLNYVIVMEIRVLKYFAALRSFTLLKEKFGPPSIFITGLALMKHLIPLLKQHGRQ
jgi:hypothetical protein